MVLVRRYGTSWPDRAWRRYGNGGWCFHQPPLSQTATRTGEGASALLGRFRPEPFGPGRSLGFHSRPCGSSGPLTGFPPKPCDFAGLPVWVLSKHRCFANSLRDSRPKAGNRRTFEEIGFGLRLALLPQSPVHRFRCAFVLANSRRFRGGRGHEQCSVSGEPLTGRESPA